MSALARRGSDLLLRCRIKARSHRNAFIGVQAGEFVIATTAPPVDGQANAALCELVARAFGVAASRVSVVRGEHARHKQVLIRGADSVPEALLALGLRLSD
jgi:uncharacterized protein (TIGR00251 family)